MFIPDLSTFAYITEGENVRAIGWLDGPRSYRAGSVPEPVLATLARHIAGAYVCFGFLGGHHCSLCTCEDPPFGVHNLLIPTREFLYVAPELILHYIKHHDYRPPDEFLEAVMACPRQQSRAYFELLSPFTIYENIAVPEGSAPVVSLQWPGIRHEDAARCPDFSPMFTYACWLVECVRSKYLVYKFRDLGLSALLATTGIERSKSEGVWTTPDEMEVAATKLRDMVVDCDPQVIRLVEAYVWADGLCADLVTLLKCIDVARSANARQVTLRIEW
jgi:hypothetical protein